MLHHQETLHTSPFLLPRHLDSPKENHAGECAAAAAKLIRTEGKPGNNIVRRTNAPADFCRTEALAAPRPTFSYFSHIETNGDPGETVKQLLLLLLLLYGGGGRK